MGSRLKKRLKFLSNQVRDSLICYRLKVSLLDSKPAACRVVKLDGTFTLGALHEILQELFEWKNSQLHMFIVDGAEFIDPEYAVEEREQWDENISLVALKVKQGDSFTYEYDGARLELVVEEVVKTAEPGKYPMVLDAAALTATS